MDMLSLLWTCVWLFLETGTFVDSDVAKSNGELQEFCQTDTFTADCGEDVIMITSAQYGRMESGKCVTRDYGYIGCSKNVLSIADQKCSGRHQCEIRIPDEDMEATQPCPEDLKLYLEASFICLKVVWAAKDLCQGANYVKLTSSTGYLASVVTEESGCGGQASPWIIEAKPGQKINITLYDFSRNDIGQNIDYITPEDICRQLAVVQEKARKSDITVCGDNKRGILVYTSITDRIQIEIIPTSSEDPSVTFLLQYEVYGCPNLPKSEGAVITRQGSSSTVKCRGTEVYWQVKCINNEWHGYIGNCSAHRAEKVNDPWGNEVIPYDLSIVIIAAVSVLIGLCILVLGLLYLRRRHRPHGTQMIPAEMDVMYSTGTCSEKHIITHPGSLRSEQYRTLGSDENEYALIWEIQNPGQMQLCSNKNYSGEHCGTMPKRTCHALREDCHVYQCSRGKDGATPQYFELDPNHPSASNTLQTDFTYKPPDQ